MPPAALTLPNFFLVGAPKAGTTSLYHYLDQHPQIYMSPIKEPCYFSSEIRPDNFSDEHRPWVRREVYALRKYLSGPIAEKRFGGMVSEWESYLKLFQNVAGETAIGEASVCYLWSQTAAANIASRIPNAKIIMILRNPAEQAFSQYLHTITDGLVRQSFREQIDRSLRSRREKLGILHPFLEFGLYYQQVKRYLKLFPGENLRIYLYEDEREQIHADVLRFLSVESNFSPGKSHRHMEPRVPRATVTTYFLKKYGVWRQAAELSPRSLRPLVRRLAFKPRKTLVMDPRDRQYLLAYYREDIRNLSGLLDRDLTGWLSCESVE